jgi:hypothetical protein
MKLSDIHARRALAWSTAALAGSLLVACGGGGSSPNGTIQGTAAMGQALSNANVQLTCKNGSLSTTTNANGAYAASFKFDGPCIITATSGSISLSSFASGAGTYNITGLTELLLTYLAGQLDTTLNGLLTGLMTNTTFQNALTNPTTISNAENAIAALVKKQYGVTLSTNAFLTTAFTPGQPGQDADLDALLTAGAITSTGQPVASLSNAALAAGQANPLSGGGSGTTPTGGTGGSGSTT